MRTPPAPLLWAGAEDVGTPDEGTCCGRGTFDGTVGIAIGWGAGAGSQGNVPT